MPAPTGSKDIDWLYLIGIDGELEDEVYCTDTRHGQPPAEVCTLRLDSWELITCFTIY